MHLWPSLLINASIALRYIIKGNLTTTGFVLIPTYRTIYSQHRLYNRQPFPQEINSSFNFHDHNGHHRNHVLYLHKRKFLPLNTSSGKVVKYGVVVSCKGGMDFMVKLDDTEKPMLCKLAGILFKRRKFIAVNARVKVECSLLDPESGRIIERL